MTASTPRMHRWTNARSTIVPTLVVNGDGVRSTATISCAVFCNVRTRPSPKCPLLPVIRILIVRQSYRAALDRAGPRPLRELRSRETPELQMLFSRGRDGVDNPKSESVGHARARRVEPIAVDLHTIDCRSSEGQTRERRSRPRGESAAS